jgi:hypothetical protein
VTAHDLVAWFRWASAGETEEEKKARTARIQRHLFPEDIDDIERTRRERILDYVKKIGEPPSWDGWPEPRPVPDEIVGPPPPPPIEWEGLISPSSKAYRRGSLHDGTAEEVQQMRERSKGSPFDVIPDDPVPSRRGR